MMFAKPLLLTVALSIAATDVAGGSHYTRREPHVHVDVWAPSFAVGYLATELSILPSSRDAGGSVDALSEQRLLKPRAPAVERVAGEPQCPRDADSSCHRFRPKLDGMVSGLIGTLRDLLAMAASIDVNWNAVNAIASFSVVLVAVAPIFVDYRRRKQQAQALRAHLGVRLREARIVFAGTHHRHLNQQDPEAGKISSPDAPLTHWETQPIEAIEALMPQAHLLEPREFRMMSAAFMVLSNTRRMPLLWKDGAHYAVTMIDAALNELKKGEPPGGHGSLATREERAAVKQKATAPA